MRTVTTPIRSATRQRLLTMLFTTEPMPTMPDSSRPDEVPDSPAGLAGTLSSPVPAGRIADVGSGWKVQVLGVERDATAAVMEENPFNDPPPDGSVFTIVRVAVGYYGTEEPASWFELNISAVASKVEQDSDCGLIPDAFPFRQVYAGGTFEGNVCFVSSADATGATLYAEEFFSFDNDRAFLELADPTTIEPMPELVGPQSGADASARRNTPIAPGTATVLGSEWSVTVGGGRVATAEILEENPFNDPPPPGFDFYLVDIDATYNGDDTGSIFDLDIIGVAADETDSLVIAISEAFDFEAVASYFAPR